MNLKKICRLCLSCDRALYPLFGANQVRTKSDNIPIDVVLNMFTISTSADNIRPSEICIKCLTIIDSAYEFRLLCAKREASLKLVFKNNLPVEADGICRTCLKSDGPKLSIFGVLFHLKDTMYETMSIIELLQLFYGIKIKYNNKRMLNYICISCIEEVKQIFAFKLKCEIMEKKYATSLYSTLLQAQNQIKTNKSMIPAMIELSSIEIKKEIFDDYEPNIRFESITFKKEFEINFTDNSTILKPTNNILDCGSAILDNLPAEASEISDPLFVLDSKNPDAEMIESSKCDETIDKTLATKEIANDTMMTDETAANEDETRKIKVVKKRRKRGPVPQNRLKKQKILPKVQAAKATTQQYETSEQCQKYSMKCPLCFVIVPTVDLLGNHIKTNHTDGTSCELCYESNIIWPDHINVHCCKICFITFCGKTAVAMHMKKHKMSKYRCTVCRKNCRSREILNRHIKLQHRSLQYKCKLCAFSARNKVRLTRHMQTGHYTCRDCPKIFETLGGLRQHEFEHTGQARYQCEICLLVCNSRRHLIEHKKFHGTGPVLYECKFCKKKFKAQAERDAHIKEHIETISNLSTHKCEICSKEFTKRSEAENHKRKHAPSFKCNICPSTFQRKRFLCMHMKTHRSSVFPTTTRSNRKVVMKKQHQVGIGIKRFGCEKCGRHFLTKKLLAEHVESHKDIKKNQKCTVCSGIFKSEHGLHIHLSRAHGIKEHMEPHKGIKKNPKCKVCSAVFKSERGLLIHFTKAHGTKGHTNIKKSRKCTVCSGIFKSDHGLHIHLTKAHGIKKHLETHKKL